MTLPLVLLAGGMATRMQPLTAKIPKSLIQVAGDYFICHQLRYLKQQGLSKIVLCLGHLADQIANLLGDGSNFGLELHYSWDGLTLLGTGGALMQALSLVGERFFVLYGDSYLPIDFKAIEAAFLKSAKPAMMTVLHNKGKWGQSNLIFDQTLVVEYDKEKPKPRMEYIDYGLSILTASCFMQSSLQGTFDLAFLFKQLAAQRILAGFEVFERFYEIGSMEGLKATGEFLVRCKSR